MQTLRDRSLGGLQHMKSAHIPHRKRMELSDMSNNSEHGFYADFVQNTFDSRAEIPSVNSP